MLVRHSPQYHLRRGYTLDKLTGSLCAQWVGQEDTPLRRCHTDGGTRHPCRSPVSHGTWLRAKPTNRVDQRLDQRCQAPSTCPARPASAGSLESRECRQAQQTLAQTLAIRVARLCASAQAPPVRLPYLQSTNPDVARYPLR